MCLFISRLLRCRGMISFAQDFPFTRFARIRFVWLGWSAGRHWKKARTCRGRLLHLFASFVVYHSWSFCSSSPRPFLLHTPHQPQTRSLTSQPLPPPTLLIQYVSHAPKLSVFQRMCKYVKDEHKNAVLYDHPLWARGREMQSIAYRSERPQTCSYTRNHLCPMWRT